MPSRVRSSRVMKLILGAVVDRRSEEQDRLKVKRAFQKAWEIPSPENFSLPVYVKVDTSQEETSTPTSKIVKKRRRLICGR